MPCFRSPAAVDAPSQPSVPRGFSPVRPPGCPFPPSISSKNRNYVLQIPWYWSPSNYRTPAVIGHRRIVWRFSAHGKMASISPGEGWLVVLRINVDLAIFQPYLDLEAGDNQSLKIQVARPGIEPRSSCSASQELNHSATAVPAGGKGHRSKSQNTK